LVSGVARVTRGGLPTRWACYPGQVVNPLCKRYAVFSTTAGGPWVSGSVAVLFFKGLFIFSLTVLYAIADVKVSDLEGGPPFFQRESLYPVVLVGADPGWVSTGLSPGEAFRSRKHNPPGPARSPKGSLTTTSLVSVDWSGGTKMFQFPRWCTQNGVTPHRVVRVCTNGRPG